MSQKEQLYVQVSVFFPEGSVSADEFSRWLNEMRESSKKLGPHYVRISRQSPLGDFMDFRSGEEASPRLSVVSKEGEDAG